MHTSRRGATVWSAMRVGRINGGWAEMEISPAVVVHSLMRPMRIS
jgi:hypothetical protein